MFERAVLVMMIVSAQLKNLEPNVHTGHRLLDSAVHPMVAHGRVQRDDRKCIHLQLQAQEKPR